MADEDSGINFLIESAKRGYEEQMEELLNSGHSIHETDSMGNTALHWAAAGNHLEAVQLAIKFGANINTQNNYGETPLHKAVWKNHVDVAEFLVQSGAETEIQNKQQQTPLALARLPELRRLLYKQPLSKIISLSRIFWISD